MSVRSVSVDVETSAGAGGVIGNVRVTGAPPGPGPGPYGYGRRARFGLRCLQPGWYRFWCDQVACGHLVVEGAWSLIAPYHAAHLVGQAPCQRVERERQVADAKADAKVPLPEHPYGEG